MVTQLNLQRCRRWVRALGNEDIVIVTSGLESTRHAASRLEVAENESLLQHLDRALNSRKGYQRTMLVETKDGHIVVLNASHLKLRELFIGEFHGATRIA